MVAADSRSPRDGKFIEIVSVDECENVLFVFGLIWLMVGCVLLMFDDLIE
jgi:hypothetical protein